jgi:hypothetical protein
MKVRVAGEPRTKPKKKWRPGWFRETTHKSISLQVREYRDEDVAVARARRGTREAFYVTALPDKGQPMRALIRLLADLLDKEDLLFAQYEFQSALDSKE